MFAIDHALEFHPPTSLAHLSRLIADHQERVSATPTEQAPAPARVPEFVELAKDELAVAQAHLRLGIRCVRGQLWITEDWNAQDVLLEPGDTYRATGTGRVVIVAFAPSAYRTVVAPRAALWFAPWRFVAERLGVVLTNMRKRAAMLAPRYAD